MAIVLIGADEQLVASTYVPVNNTGSMGGAAVTSTLITSTTPGLWMPKLPSPATGTLDTDAIFQLQQAYLWNAHDPADPDPSDWLEAGFWMNNLLDVPGVAGPLTFTPVNAADNATYKIRTLMKESGLLQVEDVTLAGATPVSGLRNCAQAYRCAFCLASNSNLVLGGPAGLIQVKQGATEIGYLVPGFPYATSEFQFAAWGTIGDVTAFANRVVDPTTLGLTWVRPRNLATKLFALGGPAGSATLAPNARAAILCWQVGQPGLTTARMTRSFTLDGQAA